MSIESFSSGGGRCGSEQPRLRGRVRGLRRGGASGRTCSRRCRRLSFAHSRMATWWGTSQTLVPGWARADDAQAEPGEADVRRGAAAPVARPVTGLATQAIAGSTARRWRFWVEREAKPLRGWVLPLSRPAPALLLGRQFPRRAQRRGRVRLRPRARGGAGADVRESPAGQGWPTEWHTTPANCSVSLARGQTGLSPPSLRSVLPGRAI